MVSVREFVAKRRSFTLSYQVVSTILMWAVHAVCSSNLVAQTENKAPVAQQHFKVQPGQPIDYNSLPADVLNCDECRSRLGLPPLPQQFIESKVEPKSDEEEVAATKPTLKQLGKLNGEPEPSNKPSIPDALRLDGVLTSPATQRIEIEILKRQLQERDAHLKQFRDMQSNVEERIDQLVRMNEELAKKDAGRQAELDRLEKSSKQALQDRELEISNLRADLASVRADANEKMKRLNDQILEVESNKAKEIAKLSNELIEAKQARIEAVTSLRNQFATNQESAAMETAKMVAEQAKTLESQRATISKLEQQLADAEKVQRADAERLERLRTDLSKALAARTKALNELTKQSTQAKKEESRKSKPTESVKSKPILPAMATPSELPAAKTEPAPVEKDVSKTRRAF